MCERIVSEMSRERSYRSGSLRQRRARCRKAAATIFADAYIVLAVPRFQATLEMEVQRRNERIEMLRMRAGVA